MSAKVPGNESSRAISLRRAKVPGSEKAKERKGQGAKVPGSELARVLLADSLLRANWPGSEKAVNPTLAIGVALPYKVQRWTDDQGDLTTLALGSDLSIESDTGAGLSSPSLTTAGVREPMCHQLFQP